jgi:hypothetical protein
MISVTYSWQWNLEIDIIDCKWTSNLHISLGVWMSIQGLLAMHLQRIDVTDCRVAICCLDEQTNHLVVTRWWSTLVNSKWHKLVNAHYLLMTCQWQASQQHYVVTNPITDCWFGKYSKWQNWILRDHLQPRLRISSTKWQKFANCTMHSHPARNWAVAQQKGKDDNVVKCAISRLFVSEFHAWRVMEQGWCDSSRLP